MTTTTSTSSTSSSGGSSILTALGAGSGIDTGALVTSLVSASFDPKDKVLKTKEDANTAKISSLGTLTSGIDAFASALQSLVAGGTLKTQPTTSDSSVLTAAAQAGASIGALSAQLEVRQVATAQSVYSLALSNSATAVGTGNLKLTTGSGNFNIAIDSTNNSLAGLAAAINATNTGNTPSGVTASVVTDTSGARLVIKGQTGAANRFDLNVGSGGATPELTRFTTTASGTHLTESQAATNAIIRMDGVDASFGSNSVRDLFPGVTLNLVSAKPGTTISLGFNRPTDAITQAVNDYVSAYNQLRGELNTAMAVGSGGSGQGPLYGNSAIKQMQRQLQQITSTALSAYPDGPRTLAEIGVSTGQDGTLSVDSTRLSKSLATYPDAVEAMFNPGQRSDNPLIKITSTFGSAKPGTYAVNITSASPIAGDIGGKPGLPSSTDPSGLIASITSPAAGLAIQIQGNIGSANVTVDAGLSGILQGIRDSLRANGGIFASLNDTLSAEKSKLADNRTKLETQESAYKDQLTAQFTAMQTKVASYKAIQSYMTQQIAAWSKSD